MQSPVFNPSRLLICAVGLAVTFENLSAHAQESPVVFYRTYCLECHNNKEEKGEFNMEPMLSSAARDHLGKWLDVLDQVQFEDMPPKKAKQPTAAERDRALHSLRGLIAANQGEKGRLTRRMNRAQYNNTIRDLLHIDAKPANAFPQDLGREGFDHVSEAQSVSPFLMEKYFDAAGAVLDLAVVTGERPQPIHTFHYPISRDQRSGAAPLKPGKVDMTPFLGKQPGTKPFDSYIRESGTSLRPFDLNNAAGDGKRTREGKGAHGYETVMTHDGRSGVVAAIKFRNELPLGRYRVTIRAYAEPAAGRDGQPLARTGPCVMGIDVNGERFATVDVPISNEPKEFVFNILTDRASSAITISAAGLGARAFVQALPSLVLCEAEFEGPILETWPPTSHQALFGPAGDWTPQKTLESFLPRAFRRPVAAEEIASYVSLAEKELGAGATPTEAIKVALQAALVSPNFLFLTETTRADAQLDDFELASRLSYFLWESMPDAHLFELAASKKLKDPEVLRSQVMRMIADPKCDSFVTNFSGQWLGLRRMADVAPDPDVFKGWDEGLRNAMGEESERFFEHILRENFSALNFIDSRFTFLNERLAQHYGIEGVEGHDFRKVDLDASSHRGGVLTHASILTIGSQPTRTSPVFRGVFVVEKLFNRPPPNPPAQVPDLPEDAGRAEPRNLREQLAAHVADPNCASCHEKIDPWGIAMESYDGIGRWRELAPDDVTTTAPGNRTMVGIDGLKKELLNRRTDFLQGLTEKLLLYALGRTLELEDKEEIPAILAAASKDNYRFQDLLAAVVLSKPFLKQ